MGKFIVGLKGSVLVAQVKAAHTKFAFLLSAQTLYWPRSDQKTLLIISKSWHSVSARLIKGNLQSGDLRWKEIDDVSIVNVPELTESDSCVGNLLLSRPRPKFGSRQAKQNWTIAKPRPLRDSWGS